MFLVPWKKSDSKEINPFRVFDEEFDRVFDLSLPNWFTRGGTTGPAWTPAIDIVDGKAEAQSKQIDIEVD